MPELPELEAFKKYIDIHCLGKTIAAITTSDKKVIKGVTFPTFQKSLVGHTFVQTQRRGKFLIITLDRSNQLLVMHFGLTGYLFYTKDEHEKVPYSTVEFIFKDHSVLHWNSIRKFEKIWLVQSLDRIKELKSLGPDALKITQQQFLIWHTRNNQKILKHF